MMKNPTILFTLLKVFAIVVLLPALIVFFSGLSDGFVTAIVGFAEVYAIILAIMFVLSLLGYTLLAAIYGWKYIVLFEMDDKEVTHAQQDDISTFIASGYCGGDTSYEYDIASGAYKNLTWTLYDDNRLVISGNGAMQEYQLSFAPEYGGITDAP